MHTSSITWRSDIIRSTSTVSPFPVLDQSVNHLHLSTHDDTQALYAAGGLEGHSWMQAGKEPPGHPLGAGVGAGGGGGDGDGDGDGVPVS